MLISDVDLAWRVLRGGDLESALFVAYKECWEVLILRQVRLLASLLAGIAPELKALTHVFCSKRDCVGCLWLAVSTHVLQGGVLFVVCSHAGEQHSVINIHVCGAFTAQGHVRRNHFNGFASGTHYGLVGLKDGV